MKEIKNSRYAMLEKQETSNKDDTLAVNEVVLICKIALVDKAVKTATSAKYRHAFLYHRRC